MLNDWPFRSGVGRLVFAGGLMGRQGTQSHATRPDAGALGMRVCLDGELRVLLWRRRSVLRNMAVTRIKEGIGDETDATG